jgi:hypothetical protein
MPHSDDRTLGTLARGGARPPVTPLVMGRRATTLVGLARPAGKLAGLLVLESCSIRAHAGPRCVWPDHWWHGWLTAARVVWPPPG